MSARTVIRAKLAYTLPPAASGAYIVLPQVTMLESRYRDTGRYDMTFDGTFESRQYPKPTKPAGEVEIRFPLRHVIPTGQVADPLRLWFYLNVRTGKEWSQCIAMVGPLTYQLTKAASLHEGGRSSGRSLESTRRMRRSPLRPLSSVGARPSSGSVRLHVAFQLW